MGWSECGMERVWDGMNVGWSECEGRSVCGMECVGLSVGWSEYGSESGR